MANLPKLPPIAELLRQNIAAGPQDDERLRAGRGESNLTSPLLDFNPNSLPTLNACADTPNAVVALPSFNTFIRHNNRFESPRPDSRAQDISPTPIDGHQLGGCESSAPNWREVTPQDRPTADQDPNNVFGTVHAGSRPASQQPRYKLRPDNTYFERHRVSRDRDRQFHPKVSRSKPKRFNRQLGIHVSVGDYFDYEANGARYRAEDADSITSGLGDTPMPPGLPSWTQVAGLPPSIAGAEPMGGLGNNAVGSSNNLDGGQSSPGSINAALAGHLAPEFAEGQSLARIDPTGHGSGNETVSDRMKKSQIIGQSDANLEGKQKRRRPAQMDISNLLN